MPWYPNGESISPQDDDLAGSHLLSNKQSQNPWSMPNLRLSL